MSRESKILAGVLVAVVAAMIGLFMLANQGEVPAAVGDKTKIVRDSSHKIGSGPVQVVEFGDYQCPACGVIQDSVDQLLKEDSAKMTFYFRNFPLVSSHQNANSSALAAEAAGTLGKFWQMHGRIYSAQDEWSLKTDPTDIFVGYAKELGLDEEAFRNALADAKTQAIIDQDTADANALGIDGTPTFYINGVKYTGKTDYESLHAAVVAAAGGASPTATPAATTPAPTPTPTPTPAQ